MHATDHILAADRGLSRGDGQFNLYSAAFAEGEFGDFKRLDLYWFCDDLLPGLNIVAVRYFTARVKPLPHDPDNYRRQDACLRALSTCPRLSGHLGQFTKHTVPARLSEPAGNLPSLAKVRVHRTEEKGSHVNLASYMLLDGFKDLHDVAVVVSDDFSLRFRCSDSPCTRGSAPFARGRVCGLLR